MKYREFPIIIAHPKSYSVVHQMRQKVASIKNSVERARGVFRQKLKIHL